MRNRSILFYFLLPFLLTLLIFGFVFSVQATQPTRKIIIVNKGASFDDMSVKVKLAGGAVIKKLPLISALVVAIPSKAAEEMLSRQPEVIRIDDDVIITATAKPAPAPQPSPQILPWGVDRIDAELAWANTSGQAVKVAVIDTGVDLDHPDLIGNIKGGFNTISLRKRYNDDNGHGAHVAGIIAAANNSFGVVGVAPKVGIYAVKALDSNGNGYLSLKGCSGLSTTVCRLSI